jgi:hypothetical protein
MAKDRFMWQDIIKVRLTEGGCEHVNYIKPDPMEHL